MPEGSDRSLETSAGGRNPLLRQGLSPGGARRARSGSIPRPSPVAARATVITVRAMRFIGNGLRVCNLGVAASSVKRKQGGKCRTLGGKCALE